MEANHLKTTITHGASEESKTDHVSRLKEKMPSRKRKSKHKRSRSSRSDTSSDTGSDGSSDTSDSSSSSYSDSSCEGNACKKRKRSHSKGKKKRKNSQIDAEKHTKRKKLKKLKKRKDRKKKKVMSQGESELNNSSDIGPSPSLFNRTSKEKAVSEVVPIKRVMTPMTKEEWEREQNTVRRVFDPETGRNRLVKGKGEIIEECVSKKRHKEINKQATAGDGLFYQTKAGLHK